MNYAAIKKHDTANGPGVRVSLFVSGCTHHCKGCFNPETWDFNYGKEFTKETEEEILDALGKPYIRGLSILGGEPLEPQNQEVLADFLERVKEKFPEKDVWCYTGYRFDRDLLVGKVGNWDTMTRMLDNVDILVDGKFEESLKDPNLRFRGSSNQRIICVHETVEWEEIVLWSEE